MDNRDLDGGAGFDRLEVLRTGLFKNTLITRDGCSRRLKASYPTEVSG